MLINGYKFTLVCAIKPQKNAKGTILQFTPQNNYDNKGAIRLNKCGRGKFCRFRIPANLNHSGVYIITVNKEHRYVGECANLSLRFNMGYGQISPRNCFMGGQETNCRLNKLILEEAHAGKSIQLWFLRAMDYKRVEQELRGERLWQWNRI